MDRSKAIAFVLQTFCIGPAPSGEEGQTQAPQQKTTPLLGEHIFYLKTGQQIIIQPVL